MGWKGRGIKGVRTRSQVDNVMVVARMQGKLFNNSNNDNKRGMEQRRCWKEINLKWRFKNKFNPMNRMKRICKKNKIKKVKEFKERKKSNRINKLR